MNFEIQNFYYHCLWETLEIWALPELTKANENNFPVKKKKNHYFLKKRYLLSTQAFHVATSDWKGKLENLEPQVLLKKIHK